MSDFDFSQPQRQSRLGLILIFATSLYHLARNLWVVVVYFFFKDFDVQTTLMVVAGIVAVLIITLGYSIISFMKFKFHIDEKNEEFVLEKGVFSSDVINIPFNKIQQVNFKRNLLQRVVGVYSVRIETAGSHEKEVEIKALSKEKADVLANRLMLLKGKSGIEEVEEADTPEEKAVEKKAVLPEWEHKVSVITLIKLGLTSNYLRGLGILVAFYFTIREQFMLEDTLPGEISQPQNFSPNFTFLLIIFFLFIGMFITVMKTVLEYYGLHIQKFRDSLQVEMGLRNNTRVNLRANRVQVMQVLVNPLQQWLNLYKLKISLASSENDLSKNQVKIPGLPKEIVEQVKQYFYKSAVPAQNVILPHRLLIFRRIMRSLIPLFLGLMFAFFYREIVNWNWIWTAAALYVVVTSIYQVFYVKNLKLFFSGEFLIKESGVWVRNTQYLEMFRLQAVSLHRPIWYKRRELTNLVFHSAGGDISFPVVDEKAVQPLVNYLLYKIESTEKAWM